MELTRIEQTEKRYKMIAKRLVQRFSKEQKKMEGSTGDMEGDFLLWMQRSKSEWSTDTWKQYKSALVFHFGTQPKWQHLASELKAMTTDGCISKAEKNRRNRGPNKKAKNIKEQDFLKLQNELASIDTEHSQIVLFMTEATLYTGLRPSEWATTSLLPKEPGEDFFTLKVKNAKHTNGRAHGEYRHIQLKGFTKDHLEVIAKAIAYSENYSEEHWKEKQIRKVQDWLYNVTRRLWPNRKQRPTLYTFRHQFSANLKYARYTKVEIAALFGHESDETATIHYGKKVSGDRRGRIPLPKAREDEMLKVHKKHKMAPQLRSSSPSKR